MNERYNFLQHSNLSVTFIFLLAILSSLFISPVNAQGFKISIQLKGIDDTICYLANYYGDKTYLIDTAEVDKKGRFTFEADTALPRGIYIIAGQASNKYMELMVDQEQVFSVAAQMPDLPGTIDVKNSPENELFYTYINYNIKNRKAYERLAKKLKSAETGSENHKNIEDSLKILNEDMEIYKEKLIRENPGSFVAVILKAMNDPDPEKFPITEEQRKDSVFVYQYYKNHFWDNVDIADARLLRTPIFHKKLETYFTKIVYQDPDSLIDAIDNFAARVEPNREIFKYVIWYLTYKFETSKIMGFDEIFVHMVDSYYATGKAFWAGPSVIKTMKEQADKLRKILIGQSAPNLILLDTAGGFTSLYQQKAPYMIVLFYEAGCSHCRKEIDALLEWLQNDTLGIKVYAACTDTALVKWKKFVDKKIPGWINVNATRSVTPDYHDLYDINMTPAVFLLDEKKKIIAKRLKVDQLGPFLLNYIRIKHQQL